jgi:hypothetical protein
VKILFCLTPRYPRPKARFDIRAHNVLYPGSRDAGKQAGRHPSGWLQPLTSESQFGGGLRHVAFFIAFVFKIVELNSVKFKFLGTLKLVSHFKTPEKNNGCPLFFFASFFKAKCFEK